MKNILPCFYYFVDWAVYLFLFLFLLFINMGAALTVAAPAIAGGSASSAKGAAAASSTAPRASASVNASSAENLGSREYWLHTYGEMKESPLTKRAQEVFQKVLSAADRRAGLEPMLFCLNYDGLPWAQSLADGSIILTQPGLAFCYQGKTLDQGDARLAFVLGHELAHQFNGDFWPYLFFRSLKKGGENRLAFQEVRKAVTDPKTLLAREFQADQYGILYAALAGFRTEEIVSQDTNFFLEWAQAADLSEAFPDQAGYPTPDERAVAIMLRLKEVSGRLGVFTLGVITYHLGWFEEAQGLFESFARSYPGREVLANTGITYLCQAYEGFCSSKEGRALPFTLSFGPQLTTRAESIRIRRKDPSRSNGGADQASGNLAGLSYKELIAKAIEYLKKAEDRDPFYFEAKNSLGCAYILEGKYHEAMAVLEAGLALKQNDHCLRNNLAVVSYLLGRQIESAKLISRAKEEWSKMAHQSPTARQNKAVLSRLEGKAGAGGRLSKD